MTIPAFLMARLSEMVEARLGLHFPPERWSDLERKTSALAGQFHFADGASCAEWLASSALTKEQVGILASHLTVGETSFFRDARFFHLLEYEILPELIRLRRGISQHLRIWSAGCCTGEEPYSVAMIVHRLLAGHRDWQATILATDINPYFLEKAAAGVYGAWSFRGTPAWVRQRYFTPVPGGRAALVPQIKQLVSFRPLNLAAGGFPSLLTNTTAMDVILCRNVLMYFAPERVREVAARFNQALVAGGWLMVGPCELGQVSAEAFRTVSFPGAIVYRKAGAEVGTTDARPAELAAALVGR